jgi:putative addiction module killer protein
MINTINEYVDELGKSYYAQWLGSIKNPRGKARIIMQVDKMELGLFGDSQPIGNGLSELRIHYGPGYRVYYGKEDMHRYLILMVMSSNRRLVFR